MRNRYLLLADTAITLLAGAGAFAVRFGWDFANTRPEFPVVVGVAVVVRLAIFHWFGIYQRYWPMAGFWDFLTLALANAAAFVVLMVVLSLAGLLGWFTELSRLVPMLEGVFALALTVGVRVSLRAYEEVRSDRARATGTAQAVQRLLIVGAGDAGALAAREMLRNPTAGLLPVGLLDDDPTKMAKQIGGLRVLGAIEALEAVVLRERVDEVLIAQPAAGGPAIRRTVELCRRAGVPFRVLPGMLDLLDGRVVVNRLRPVDIADLLRRPEAAARPEGLAYLRGARVAVTGAGGSIGAEVCRQAAFAGAARLLLIGHGENSIFEIAGELRRRFPTITITACIADIRDRPRMTLAFEDFRPDVVFHAAAHKHVALMEDNPAEAVTNNITGTRHVLAAAEASGVSRFVLVSSDKAASPRNVMGATKRVAEQLVQRAARHTARPYAVVRFGNVLGSRGSVVPIFKAQIERGGPVTVTHPDVRRYFMTIPEAVHLILQAGGLGTEGDLFVLDMGHPVSVRDLAADMIRLSGLTEDEVPIVYTGLKPGEKLDEILWEDGADVQPTACPDVRRVREPGAAESAALDELVNRLESAAVDDDESAIVALLRTGLPTATALGQTDVVY